MRIDPKNNKNNKPSTMAASSSSTMTFKVGKCPNNSLALTNKVYFNPS
jgi:hypothetical protein